MPRYCLIIRLEDAELEVLAKACWIAKGRSKNFLIMVHIMEVNV